MKNQRQQEKKNPELKNLSHWAKMGHQIINRNNFKSYVEVQTSNIFTLNNKLKILNFKNYFIN